MSWKSYCLPSANAFAGAEAGNTKQDARLFGTQPGTCVQPAHKRQRDVGITELAVPIDAPYFGCMFPGGVGSCAILGQTGHVADAELGGHIRDNIRRDVGWLGQERAQEPSGGQLEREPELVLCAAPHFDQLKVGIVEVKVALELLVRGWSAVVTVRQFLGVGKEFGWHWPRSLRRRRSANSDAPPMLS